MGTWDTGSFGNDAALDYLQTVNDIQKVASTIRHNYSGYIDADAACEVVAACEIIATMLNRPAPDVPEEAIARFGSLEVPDEELLADARDVLKSVSISSELADLWAEEEDKEWKEAIADLSSRLDTDSDYERPAFAEAALGPVHAVCILCELSIPDEDAVDLIHEVDDGIVFSSMTLHAHRRCVEKVFGPPHWNSDGTPSDGVLRQFAQFVDTESGT